IGGVRLAERVELLEKFRIWPRWQIEIELILRLDLRSQVLDDLVWLIVDERPDCRLAQLPYAVGDGYVLHGRLGLRGALLRENVKRLATVRDLQIEGRCRIRVRLLGLGDRLFG